MFRVERISLPAESPVGQVAIGSATCRLSDFDLVIIQGANGAGKTSIVSPLCSWSVGTTLRWHGDSALEPTEAEAKAALLPWLLHRNSVELMSEFQSPESALASVSGIGRLREEVELLRKLAPEASRPAGTNALATLTGNTPPGRSQAVSDAIHRYESSERSAFQGNATLPGDAPLTFAQYNEWGREAAAAIGTNWFDVDEGSAKENPMRAAEERVRPQPSVIPGANDVKAAVQELAASIRANPVGNRLGKLNETACSLKTATDALAAELSIEPSVTASCSLHEQSTALCRELESEASKLDQQAKAIDALAQLRSDAAKVLVELNCDTCPVCEATVARERLLERLSSMPADVSGALMRSEAVALRVRKCSIESLASALERRKSEHETAKSNAISWMHDRAKEVDACAKRLLARDGWDDVAMELAAELRRSCQAIADTAMPAEGSALHVRLTSVASALERLENACREAAGRVDSEYVTRKARMNRAETVYNWMTLLRPILAARSALNLEPWHDNRKERDQVERRRARIKVWEVAVQSLISDRDTRVRESGAAVLTDPEVQHRFSALLRTTRHPLAESAKLEAGRVVSAQGTGITRTGRASRDSSKLSEGLTVLVNIAAFFAIAGHTSPHQAHKAGWVLLDEPTNGLDPENRRRLADYLGSMTIELMPKQIFITTFEDEFADMLVGAASRLGDRRILRVKLHDWRGSPIISPELIPVPVSQAG